MTILLISLLIGAAVLAIFGWVRVLRRDDFEDAVRERGRNASHPDDSVPVLRNPRYIRWTQAQLRFFDHPEMGVRDALEVLREMHADQSDVVTQQKIDQIATTLDRFQAGRASTGDLQQAMAKCRAIYDEVSESTLSQTA